MKNAGNDGVVIHIPLFKDFLNGERVNNVGLTGFAQLTLMRLGGDFDGFIDEGCSLGHREILISFLDGLYSIISTPQRSSIVRAAFVPSVFAYLLSA